MNINYTEAFRRYGASLHNTMWSVAAINDKNELVMSLWENQLRFDAATKRLVYQDQLSEWLGNSLGRQELHGLLAQAAEDGLCVRVVIAHPIGDKARAQVGEVKDESLVRKTFSVRPELRGSIKHYDGDLLRIEFEKELV